MVLTDSSQPESALEKAPLFQSLTRDQLRALGQVSTQIHEDAGKVLAQQGHRGVEFVLVLDGTASVSATESCCDHRLAAMAKSLIDGGRGPRPSPPTWNCCRRPARSAALDNMPTCSADRSTSVNACESSTRRTH
jgi:hypothetical protein